MKKLEERYLKNLTTAPAKSPSPDIHSSNKIRSTRIFKHNDLNNSKTNNNEQFGTFEQRVHSKLWGAPQQPQPATEKRHYTITRSSENITQTPYQRKNIEQRVLQTEPQNVHSYCRDNISEINLELTKMLSMISASTGNIREFHLNENQYSPEKERIRSQMEKVQSENKKLVKLVREIEEKVSGPAPCHHAYRVGQLENEIEFITNKMNSTIKDCDGEYQALYHTNQTLSSRLHSLQDKNTLLEKEVQSLRFLLREKEEQLIKREQETKRKNSSQKFTLSIIREQHNESIKMLGQNVSMRVQDMNAANEHKLQEMSMLLVRFDEKIKKAERSLMNLNSMDLKNSSKSKIDNLQRTLSAKNREIIQLQQKSNHQISQIQQLRIQLQNSQKSQDLETESRIKDLMANYEQQIKIIKRENKRIKEQNLMQESEIHRLKSEIHFLECNKEQEVERVKVSMKNSRSEELEDQNERLRKEIACLQDQLAVLRANQNQLQDDLHRVRSQSVSISQYKSLQNKKNELSKQLSQKLLELSSLRANMAQLLKQNSQLSEKAQQSTHFNEQLERFKMDRNHYQQSIDQKNNKIHELEMTIYSITKMLEQMEEKVNYLESNKEEESNHQMIIEELTDKNRFLEKELAAQKELEDQKIGQIRVELYAEIEKELREKLERDLNLKIVEEYSASNGKIKEELIELRTLIEDGKFDRLEVEFERVSQLYNQQLINSQRNQQEIQKLNRQLVEMNEKMGELEKIKIVLQQKSNILEGNNKILEDELKERKELYAQLLGKKSLLEKEINVLKQVKLDKSMIDATKARAKQIAMKIEKLLILENDRSKNPITSVISLDEVRIR